MNDGLAASFRDAMAGLTEADVERYEREQSADRGSNIEGRAASASNLTALGDVPSPVSERAAAEATPSASDARRPPPRRATDPQAISIARRLLGVEDVASGDEPPVGHPISLALLTEHRRLIVGAGGADRVTVGRHGDPSDPTQLVVALGVVSRRHCDIVVGSDAACVVDLNSANGTVVVRDGAKIVASTDGVELRPGDLVSTAQGAAVLFSVERNA